CRPPRSPLLPGQFERACCHAPVRSVRLHDHLLPPLRTRSRPLRVELAAGVAPLPNLPLLPLLPLLPPLLINFVPSCADLQPRPTFLTFLTFLTGQLLGPSPGSGFSELLLPTSLRTRKTTTSTAAILPACWWKSLEASVRTTGFQSASTSSGRPKRHVSSLRHARSIEASRSVETTRYPSTPLPWPWFIHHELSVGIPSSQDGDNSTPRTRCAMSAPLSASPPGLELLALTPDGRKVTVRHCEQRNPGVSSLLASLRRTQSHRLPLRATEPWRLVTPCPFSTRRTSSTVQDLVVESGNPSVGRPIQGLLRYSPNVLNPKAIPLESLAIGIRRPLVSTKKTSKRYNLGGKKRLVGAVSDHGVTRSRVV
ncbi:hypothetical protein IWX46DRAFT_655583, partial [Phyllosticta citricarpa]